MFDHEPTTLKAVDDALTRGFLRLPVQKSANPPASPGGNMDPGETPWDCAVREGLEETGLRLAASPRLLGVHFLTEQANWPALKVGLIFDGGRLTSEQIGRIVLDPGEHSEVVIRSLQEWQRDMSRGSFRRLAAVTEARRTGAACYLQQNDPV